MAPIVVPSIAPPLISTVANVLDPAEAMLPVISPVRSNAALETTAPFRLIVPLNTEAPAEAVSYTHLTLPTTPYV